MPRDQNNGPVVIKARPPALVIPEIDEVDDDELDKTKLEHIVDVPLYFKTSNVAVTGETTVTFIVPPEHRISLVYLADYLGYLLVGRFYRASPESIRKPSRHASSG